MNRSTLNVGLSNLKKWKEEKNALRYDLSFQRHTGMWSLPAKSMLVWSILSDSYIPPVVKKARQCPAIQFLMEHSVLPTCLAL